MLSFQFSFSQWENLNTGINDNLTGVVFLQNNGILCGENGLYYTTTGGVGSTSWTRFQITTNATDSAIYENTNFTHCFSDPLNTLSSGFVYVCGQDEATQRAIIMKIQLPTLSYEIVYTGEINTKLNHIDYFDYSNQYVAVGDNGLIVKVNSAGLHSVLNIGSSNFSSISTNSYSCKITTENKILYFDYFDNNSSTEILTPNSTNTAIKYDNSYSYVAGNRFIYYQGNNSVLSNHTNYYGGPLNAKCVFSNSSGTHVGTDHGIYLVASSNALDLESTSSNYSITDIWKQSSQTPIYACGNSGVLLKTINNGGIRTPYVNISEITGNCVGSYINLNGIRGGYTSCKWFINNVQVGTQCGTLSQQFTTPGNYEIKHTIKNAFNVESTDIKNIYISPIPQINKPVTISDAILCKNEPITIQIENSEPNIKYILRKEGDFIEYGTSGIGNGSTISFVSNSLSESGNYFLIANPDNTNCYTYFTDRFAIVVEKTESKFHADLINANNNEAVNFYENTIDAQNFQWNFSPSASVTSSNLSDPSLSFSTAGNTIVDLHSWSNNNCHDIIQKEGPHIINTPTNPDNCWTLVNNGTDLPWNGSTYEGVNQLAQTTDGFIACGAYNNQIFDSKLGITYNLLNKNGTYLTKHDKNGALKWLVYTKHVPFFNDRKDEMYSCAVDQQGNIYICGVNAGDFVDNKGDVYDLNPANGTGSGNNGYIVKLDAQGKYLWSITSFGSGFIPQKVYVDKENNLVITGYQDSYYNGQIFFNNISVPVTHPATSSQNYLILKVSPTCNLIWYTGINISASNGSSVRDIGFDSDNNLYIVGRYEYNANFYSAGNSTPVFLNGYGDVGHRQYLVKYNEDGQLLWKTRSIVTNAFFDDVDPYSMTTDDLGNSYITGSNNCDVNTGFHTFENSDGSTFQNSVGAFYVMKVNANGFCQWIQGDKHTRQSIGFKVIKNNNYIHVSGTMTYEGASESTSLFTSSNNQNYNLTMNLNDVFLATYDLSGNLIRISTNSNNPSLNYNATNDVVGLFKGDGDAFYMARNLGLGTGDDYYNFGDIITTNGVDGTISRFNESCGVIKYENVLSLEETNQNTNQFVIYPNPTNENFSIDFKSFQSEVTIKVENILGKQISSQKYNNVNQITSSIKESTGIYFVKVMVNDEIIKYFKLIKN